jgi:UDP:flavonoid glycosyltransferase YjiC (YdhE family)
LTDRRPTIALAVSGHGYGHAVRSAEVARALLERGARVVVRTDAPRWLFPEGVEWLPSPGWPVDVGVVQHDGLEFDIDATRSRWRAFAREFDARAHVEARLLRAAGADIVLGDIPPLAFVAAARASLPSFAVGNFTWDWIYAIWPDFEDIVARVRQGYGCSDALLRLPLHGTDADAFRAFKTVQDVPLVVRHARRSRQQVRSELGLSEAQTVVLVSFGGFAVGGLDVAALERWPRYTFVMAQVGSRLPPNVIGLNETPADYVSLLAACDVVVTKPGYGIVADCLANRVAVLFTDRGPFREYDVLAEALTRLGRARHVPRQDVLAGELGPHLDALLAADMDWTDQPMNGAAAIAERALHRVTIEAEQSPVPTGPWP